MTTVLLWTCGCGTSGRGEKNAQHHARTCDQMGRPRTNPHITYPAKEKPTCPG